MLEALLLCRQVLLFPLENALKALSHCLHFMHLISGVVTLKGTGGGIRELEVT